jgi:hypothetical protein
MSYTANILIAVGGGLLLFLCIPVCACFLELLNGNVPRRPPDRLSKSEFQQRTEKQHQAEI